jgi:nucleoside-diphosphate-sugar epimerase
MRLLRLRLGGGERIDARSAVDAAGVDRQLGDEAMDGQKRILIAGVSGLVGGAALTRFANRPDWKVTGVSRRKPWIPLGTAEHLSVDLLDRAACAEVFGRMSDVTHVVFAALNERDDDIFAGWSDPEQIAKNEAMLANLFDPLVAAARDFRHISILHGGKAYGVHIPGYAVTLPMYEDAPRHPGDNFYYRQHDYIAAKQQGRSWSWTIFRPGPIFGVGFGANMSPLIVLAVYGALCKEAGEEIPMPEGRTELIEPSDSDLIAEALEWAAGTPAARNEVFNINNGDLLSRHEAFPILARTLGVALGGRRRFDINAEIARLSHLWPGMVARYDLNAPADLGELFGNSLQTSRGWSADTAPENVLRSGFSSNIKIRQAGFASCVDNRVMLEHHLRRMQELRMIPA